MKKILILSTIWGHKSVGKAIYDVLKDGDCDVTQEIIRIDPFSSRSYKTFYRFFPWLFTATFQVSKSEMANKYFDKYFEGSYLKIIEKLIKKHKPDIIISSYFAFDSSIEKMMHKYKFRYFNAFTDPWTFSNIHISRSGINLVFDDLAIKKIKKSAPKSKNYIVGWFTEKKYYDSISKQEARKRLGINPSWLTLCITGGSEGTYDILKILSSLVTNKQNLQILFMCGENKQLYSLIKNISKVFAGKINKKIIPYGYTSEMNVFMKSSDLVIGKAGPSTIFESVVSGVPFFAITHITGQEDGNLEVIKKYNIGIVEEKPTRAAKRIKEIIYNPSLLSRYEKPIADLKEYIQGSGERLKKIIYE